MNEEKIIDAIGDIDESLLLETHNLRTRKRIVFPYKAAAVIAACILLTVALLPWKRMLSGNDPSITDAPNTDVLQNDDTSFIDTTDKKDDSPIVAPEGTNNDTQSSTQSTDTSDTEDAVTTLPPAVTLPPAPDVQKSPETTGPYIERPDEPDTEDTTAVEKETTGPLIPSTPGTPDHGTVLPQRPTILSRAMYPAQSPYPFLSTEGRVRQWRIAKNERIANYKSGIGNTSDFMFRTLCEFFSDYENDNIVYSPVNIYMSLGMLAETTQGSSQKQLLDLLGENDIYSVRSSAYNLWNCCYRKDGIVTTTLGSSLWLDSSFVPKTAVTDVLADYYYASSFYGNMGDEEYNDLMRSWVSEQTKGLLENEVANRSLNADSAMTLMPTVYFKANWENGFNINHTSTKTFHSPDGDITTRFMEKEHYEMLYVGETFKATRMTFMEGEEMWFILPNDNIKPLELFLDYEAMGFITGETQKRLHNSNKRQNIVLSLPRFDISSEMDLVAGLKNLGVTDVFDPEKADFSALTDSKISVGEIDHLIRVRMDENGFEAASMSETVLPSPQPPSFGDSQPVEITLDKPFIFVITSDSGLPLFVGMVNCPN